MASCCANPARRQSRPCGSPSAGRHWRCFAGGFDPERSDLDFLVLFQDLVPRDSARAYFGMRDGLANLFERPVDLVTEAGLEIPACDSGSTPNAWCFMQPDAGKYLWDVQRAAERIVRFAAGKSFEDYRNDELLRSAVERQFEIIGEALNQRASRMPKPPSGYCIWRRSSPFATS